MDDFRLLEETDFPETPLLGKLAKLTIKKSVITANTNFIVYLKMKTEASHVLSYLQFQSLEKGWYHRASLCPKVW